MFGWGWKVEGGDIYRDLCLFVTVAGQMISEVLIG